MNSQQLPTEFDLIVVGTGLLESIISAAASRVGKRVLHIDSNNYYGSVWASFHLDTIEKLQYDLQEYRSEFKFQAKTQSERLVSVGNTLFDLKDFEVQWNIPEKLDGSNQCETLCQENLLEQSRKFNIDLTPKLQFARGDFVELLISSNIARYSEFRSVSRVLTWLNGQLEIVPCSRADVFANDKVSIIEKRMIMKFFTSLDKEEVCAGWEDKPFIDFLKSKKLTPNLINYILTAISMSTENTLCLEGIQNTRRFIESFGRFGKTPFLFSMYGSGEIPQAFCRLSAVFGAVYALNQSVDGLILDADTKFRALICNKQRISAGHLVISSEKSPELFIQQYPKLYVSRAILITDNSLLQSEQEHLTLLMYPPENGKQQCIIIELGSITGTCPKGLFIVHLIAKQSISPKEDFKHCINQLFAVSNEESKKPKILWSCYFSSPNYDDINFNNSKTENIFVCSGPDTDLDYDSSIEKARTMFSKMYPSDDFLPRAPDSEDIIIEDSVVGYVEK